MSLAVRRCLTCGSPTHLPAYCSQHGRLSGGAWETVRVRVHNRDRGQCQLCGRPVSLRRARIDHIHEKGKGGSDDDTNLRTLCRACHQRETPGGGG